MAEEKPSNKCKEFRQSVHFVVKVGIPKNALNGNIGMEKEGVFPIKE